LSRQIFDGLLDHAREGYPEEICGLLGGRDEQATTSVRIPNISTTPAVRFEMDRRLMVEAIIALQRAGLDVVAIYHSHPEGGSEPSRTDIAEATWPDAVYLIIDLSNLEMPGIGAWSIQRERVSPAELQIGSKPAS
jgi:proteasome lid subunit RPN8/RPN11